MKALLTLFIAVCCAPGFAVMTRIDTEKAGIATNDSFFRVHNGGVQDTANGRFWGAGLRYPTDSDVVELDYVGLGFRSFPGDHITATSNGAESLSANGVLPGKVIASPLSLSYMMGSYSLPQWSASQTGNSNHIRSDLAVNAMYGFYYSLGSGESCTTDPTSASWTAANFSGVGSNTMATNGVAYTNSGNVPGSNGACFLTKSCSTSTCTPVVADIVAFPAAGMMGTATGSIVL